MIFIDNKGDLKVGRKKCKYHKKANVVQAAKKVLPESQLYKMVLKTKEELCNDMTAKRMAKRKKTPSPPTARKSMRATRGKPARRLIQNI
jgi:hypothetical protein